MRGEVEVNLNLIRECLFLTAGFEERLDFRKNLVEIRYFFMSSSADEVLYAIAVAAPIQYEIKLVSAVEAAMTEKSS